MPNVRSPGGLSALKPLPCMPHPIYTQVSVHKPVNSHRRSLTTRVFLNCLFFRRPVKPLKRQERGESERLIN
jgi:hypothetical protein